MTVGKNTPIKELLTVDNIVALHRLSCLLARLPDDYNHFDMGDFYEAKDMSLSPQQVRPQAPVCGTVACAVGHLMYLGYNPASIDAGFSWNVFSTEITGLPALPGDYSYTRQQRDTLMGLWNWCFSDSWGDDPDYSTARHAAMRIAFMLDYYGTGEFEGPLNCLREAQSGHESEAVFVALDEIEHIGAEKLIGARRRERLTVSNRHLMKLAPNTLLDMGA